VEACKEDILVFEMQMYVTVQFSVFASDFFCCHTFDTGIYTEEYKIYKCMLCIKIVSLIGIYVCVCMCARACVCACACVRARTQAHSCVSKTAEVWYFGKWTEITEDRHAKLCIFIEEIVFRCLLQR